MDAASTSSGGDNAASRNEKRDERASFVKSFVSLNGQTLENMEYKMVMRMPEKDFRTILWRYYRRTRRAHEINFDFIDRHMRSACGSNPSQWLFEEHEGFVYPHLENGRFYAHTTLILQRFFDVFVSDERIQRAEQAAATKSATSSSRRSKASGPSSKGSDIRAQADRINPFYAITVPLAIYRRVEGPRPGTTVVEVFYYRGKVWHSGSKGEDLLFANQANPPMELIVKLEDGKSERCWNPIRIVQNQATGELMDPQFFGTISDLLPLAVGDLWPILDSEKLWESACIPFPVRERMELPRFLSYMPVHPDQFGLDDAIRYFISNGKESEYVEKEHYQVFFKWVMHYSVYNGMATADMLKNLHVHLTQKEPFQLYLDCSNHVHLNQRGDFILRLSSSYPAISLDVQLGNDSNVEQIAYYRITVRFTEPAEGLVPYFMYYLDRSIQGDPHSLTGLMQNLQRRDSLLTGVELKKWEPAYSTSRPDPDKYRPLAPLPPPALPMMMMRSGSTTGAGGAEGAEGGDGEPTEGLLLKAGSFRSFIFDEDMTLDNYIDACTTTMDVEMPDVMTAPGSYGAMATAGGPSMEGAAVRTN